MASDWYYSWQTTKKTIKERAEQLFLTGDLSDCEFHVGVDKVQFFSHRIFLAMSSPVFYAMFFGEMAEKIPVEIKDIEPAAFRGMLQYIYTDRVDFESCNHACAVYAAASKYLLPYLKQQCEEFLLNDVGPDTACELYEFAKFHNNDDIEQMCLKVFRENTNDVLISTGFLEADCSTVTTILEQQQMQIKSELDLFEALQAWTNAEALRQEVPVESLSSLVSEAVSKIRFLSLTAEEFTAGPGLSHLLSSEEKLAITMNITKPGVVPLPDRINQVTGPRKVIVDKAVDDTWTLVRDLGDSITYPVTKWVNPFPKKGITVSRNIKLIGVKIASQKKADCNSTYTESVTVVLKKDWALKFSGAKCLMEVPYNSTFEVRFCSPVVLEAGKKYWVIVQFDKSGDYQFSRDLQNIYQYAPLNITVELTPEFSTITEFMFGEK